MIAEIRKPNSENTARHTLPVRKPPASSYGNNRHIAYSPTLERRLILGSDLEFDEWVRLEAARKRYFCEQPARVRVRLPEGPVTTVFDFWIQWDDGTEEYREVKYSQDLQSGSRALRQIEAQQLFCRLHGFKHVVSTEETIRANPLYLDNWKRILNHLGMTSSIDLRSISNKLVRILRSLGRCSIAALESALSAFDPVLVRASIYQLIHRGYLTAPLDSQQLTASLFVEVKS
jgi:hypothetical protein